MSSLLSGGHGRADRGVPGCYRRDVFLAQTYSHGFHHAQRVVRPNPIPPVSELLLRVARNLAGQRREGRTDTDPVRTMATLAGGNVTVPVSAFGYETPALEQLRVGYGAGCCGHFEVSVVLRGRLDLFVVQQR